MIWKRLGRVRGDVKVCCWIGLRVWQIHIFDVLLKEGKGVGKDEYRGTLNY